MAEVSAKARMAVFKRASNGVMSHVETIATDVNGDDFGAHLYVHVSQNGKNVPDYPQLSAIVMDKPETQS